MIAAEAKRADLAGLEEAVEYASMIAKFDSSAVGAAEVKAKTDCFRLPYSLINYPRDLREHA
jgi:hypothetical protein